ncbi:hypothetical protein GOODEAATRI_031134, partial [Goodea atripinnis]
HRTAQNTHMTTHVAELQKVRSCGHQVNLRHAHVIHAHRHQIGGKQTSNKSSPLTWAAGFSRADLGDAARVTLRSSALHHAVIIQPVGW